jgi:UDP-N-acetylglucosamine 1-carboxyvinyltransferase
MTMGRLLADLGAGFHLEKDRLTLDCINIKNYEAPYELVNRMRASVLVLGPLVARVGKAKVSLPGGCAIGARPINLHLMGLKKMGASIALDSGYVLANAKRLKGASIYFDIPTVTGTENIMMAATLAEGKTLIDNAAREPEVIDLANALISMGARIRIETGTFMTMAGITGGDVTIKNCRPDHLDALINKLKDAGIRFMPVMDGIRVIGPRKLKSVNSKTMPYPGFPTDMQAQFMALMSVAEGTSMISETIFENRFMHVAELRRMGADITIEGSTATVKGVYESIEEKLKRLGADIKREKE